MPRLLEKGSTESAAMATATLNGHINGNGTEKKRVSLVIPVALDHAIEFYCLGVGRQKNDVVTEALSGYVNTRRKDILQALQQTNAAIGRVLVSRARQRRVR